MRTHTKEKPYMCNVCGKTMSMQCHLVQHMRSHTGEKPFKCPECDKAFPSSTRLKLFYTQKNYYFGKKAGDATVDTPLTTTTSNTTTSTTTAPAETSSTYNTMTIYSDSSVDTSANESFTIYSSGGSTDTNSTETFQIYSVGTSEDQDGIETFTLYSAEATAEPTSAINSALQLSAVTEKDIFPKNICNVCINRLEDISAFIDRCKDSDNLLKKIYQEYKEKRIINVIDSDTDNDCDSDQIEGIFIKSQNKKNASFALESVKNEVKIEECESLEPQKSQQTEMLKDCRCPICKKTFYPKNKLTLHLRSHQKEMPYECPECSKKFSFAENLRRHALLHKGLKPFICDICKKGFLRKRSLDEHMNFHTGRIPYICSYCGKGFKRLTDHASHIYHNHNVNKEKVPKYKRKYTEKRVHLNLECTICGKIFASRSGFANHQLIHKGAELGDKLPKNICKNCIKDLENISAFILRCQNSDNILKRIITRRVHNENSVIKVTNLEQVKVDNFSYEHVFVKTENYTTANNSNIGDEIQESKIDVELQSSFKETDISNREDHKNCELEGHILTHQKLGQKRKVVEKTINDAFIAIKYLDNGKIGEKKKVYSCKLCGKNYQVLSKIQIHTNMHTGVKPYKCDVCDKQFTHPSSFRYHISSHIVDKPFKCKFCDWTGVNKGNLNVHLKRFHDQIEVNKVENKDLKTNMNIETSDKIFLCNICGKNFTRKSTLKTHLKIHTGEKNFECDICGFRFILKCTLIRHLAVHENEKKFNCNICGKGLSQKAYLIKHIELFHGSDKKGMCAKREKTPSYFCSVCGKGFILKKSLERHKSVHKSEKDRNEESIMKEETKDFLCTQCGKQFTFKCNLDRHILTHSGEKPFECNVCGDRFTAKNSLDCHLNIHKGIKPYQCEHCQKSFRQPSSLRKHILVHTEERRFSCHICEMAFKTSSHLKTHFKRHSYG
ncbi:hypothetical protein NQ314_019706 [Rhamnusium bicolor]|uniref:C2H2-type domain-containing protein n=1 Tax=Rhamnusium bicolor TaxID=1586634 RepID=A0AAV8WMV9_9CUCU|nr:hypothetical protein NQ314_019706 [Rhamnusium bicolor]